MGLTDIICGDQFGRLFGIAGKMISNLCFSERKRSKEKKFCKILSFFEKNRPPGLDGMPKRGNTLR